jgi:hypothetical protein
VASHRRAATAATSSCFVACSRGEPLTRRDGGQELLLCGELPTRGDGGHEDWLFGEPTTRGGDGGRENLLCGEPPTRGNDGYGHLLFGEPPTRGDSDHGHLLGGDSQSAATATTGNSCVASHRRAATANTRTSSFRVFQYSVVLPNFPTQSCITWRGYRAAAHGDRCPQCCLFFVSVAHTVVLENARTRGLYTKPCFSSRLYSLVLQVRAPDSIERGEQHRANHFKDAGPQNPEEPHPPCNAMRHTSACLSRACLWLGSLHWGEY